MVSPARRRAVACAARNAPSASRPAYDHGARVGCGPMRWKSGTAMTPAAKLAGLSAGERKRVTDRTFRLGKFYVGIAAYGLALRRCSQML